MSVITVIESFDRDEKLTEIQFTVDSCCSMELVASMLIEFGPAFCCLSLVVAIGFLS